MRVTRMPRGLPLAHYFQLYGTTTQNFFYVGPVCFFGRTTVILQYVVGDRDYRRHLTVQVRAPDVSITSAND